MDVLEELARIVAPFDAGILERALAGEATKFDVDGEWYAHHHGRPRCIGKIDAFDGEALLAGVQAVCWLGTHLPVGDERRAAVPQLYAKIVARLANPQLMLYSGTPQRTQLKGPPHRSFDWRGNEQHDGVDLGGLVDAQNYLYFRPARLVEEQQIAWAVMGAELSYPTSTFPYSGLYHVWRAAVSPGIAAIAERAAASPVTGYELDPRRSVPALVAEVAQRHGLDEAAATLYLQLLTLADCGDVWLRQVNGWTKTVLDKAGAVLVAAGLAVAAKQPRANRKVALPGTWEKLFPPHPAIERSKLAIYDAAIEGKALAAPLGRVLPLRPIHELFAEAWRRVSAEAEQRPAVADTRDWIAELRAAPEDDALRAVYGDYLTEHGDPLGELVAVQLRRAQLARTGDDAKLAELAEAERALLDQHGERWTEAVHPFIEDYRFDRGVLASITVRAPTYVKHADAIAAAAPLLEELVLFTTGGIGPIPAKHVELLVGCRHFGRIQRLDFTPDHYLSSSDELTMLLEGEWLPHLRYLRLGYHRQGGGFGADGARLIAECTRTDELRFLEVPGNGFGLAALSALFESPHLARLEVLRVPYSGLSSTDVDKLADKLERGALPALRVLDVSNVLEVSGDVTKACSFSRNRVGLDRQQRLLHILGERRGAGDQYARDGDASARPQGGFTGEVREQTGRYPFAEEAKSGTSRCIVCRETIEIRTLRIGVERMLDAVGLVTSWVHPACRTQCPELRDMADLDERLRKNSRGLWPPA